MLLQLQVFAFYFRSYRKEAPSVGIRSLPWKQMGP